MAAMKRNRAADMSSMDKHLLVEIALKYENVIENKKTDGASLLRKRRRGPT